MTTALPPAPRGYDHVGGGYVPYIQKPVIFRGSSISVSHIYPFGIGRQLPPRGIPMGKVMGERGNAPMCCDPLTWFEDLGLIGNPSVYIKGLPNMGKSTAAKRWLAVYSAWGIIPLVPADTKGEYTELILSLGGDVLPIGGGYYLNPLDLGVAPEAAKRLGEKTSAGRLLMTNARRRRQLTLQGLITVLRGSAPDDLEQDLLAVALELLDKAFTRRRTVPVPMDLLAVFNEAPLPLKEAAKWRDNPDTYHKAVDHLERNIQTLAYGRGIAEPFSRQTSQPMRLDTPTSFDLSGIEDADVHMRAAAQLTCWAHSFGQITVSHALSEKGLGSDPANPYHYRRYAIDLDELWNIIRSGRGMAGLVDSLGRLNRQKGVVEILTSHQIVEEGGLADTADKAIAEGFARRSGFIVSFATPKGEDEKGWSEQELAMLASWTKPPSLNPATRRPNHYGLGKCLIKIPDTTAIPCQTELMPSELAHMNTSKKWRQR